MGASDGSADSTTTTEQVITTSELRGYYSILKGQSVTAADAVRILDTILNRDSEEDLTIADIESALAAIRDSIVVNTSEIENLNRLLGILIFELVNQGIKIQSKELIEELELYNT